VTVAAPATAPATREPAVDRPGGGGGLGRLFPTSTGHPVTRRGVLLAAGAVAAAAVVSLLRTTGTGPLQSVYEEDASNVLTDALDTSTAKALVKPVAGYLIIGPRLLGELATLFPISWAAAVLSVSAAVICGLLALQVYVASGAHFTNVLARLAVTAPMLFAPVAENRFAELYNRPVCLHFFAMYALFWVFLWSPTTRAGRIGALVTAGLTAVSTVLVLACLPVALVRLAVRRDRFSLALLGLTTGGTALQLGAVYLGDAARADNMRLDPLWALAQYASWAMPESVLGFRATSGLYVEDRLFADAFSRNLGVVLLTWAIVLVVVAVAVFGARRGLLRPAWLLAAALGVQSVGLFAVQIMANGWISQRYLMAPALLLLAALTVLLIPARGVDLRLAVAPLAAFSVLLLFVGAFNFRWDDTRRHGAPEWTNQVHRAAVRCRNEPHLRAVTVRGAPRPAWSYVIIPCHELRGGDRPECNDAYCSWLDPPRNIPNRPVPTPTS
jgi:hypothetical protein